MNDDIFYFYCLGLLFLFMFWIYAYRGYQVECARTKAERIGENIRRAGVRGRIDESIYEESRREEEEMKKRVSEAVDRHVTFKEVE